MSKPLFIFWTTTFFYLFLWLTNASNKIIVLSFFLLIILYFLRLKNLKLSILLSYIASMVLFTGKTYPIQLLPAKVFSSEAYENGYFINLIISYSHILSFLMFIIILKEIFTNRNLVLKINNHKEDFLLILFFFWNIFSSFMSSKIPDLSFALNILSLPGLLLYFYSKYIIDNKNGVWILVSYIFASMVIFQSFVSIQQYKQKSPIFRTLESQTNIEYFGKSVDEIEFTFRPVGTFTHTNYLGIWLASMLLFILPNILAKHNKIMLIAFSVGIVALIMTLSRSAWLGFFVGIVIYSKFSKNIIFKKNVFNRKLSISYLLVIPIIVYLLISFVLPRVEKSFYSFGVNEGGGYFRKIQTNDALEVVTNYPIFGIGTGMSIYTGISLNLKTYSNLLPLEVHNWYLHLCLEKGLPSLIFFILFLYFSIKKILHKQKINFKTISIITSFAALLIAGYFQPYLNEDYIFLSLGLINCDII